MKELFESFKNYRNKLNEATDESQMKISFLLVIDRKIDRYKEDILSDIRAVTGVTIINVEQHKNVKNLDYNVVLMKFDTGPYKSPDPDVPVNVLDALLRIRKQLLRVPGIVRVKYLTKPERF
jgi:hypothetical protein